MKQLTKELNSRKSASPASSSTFGDDSLDKAIQDELNQRAVKAEKALKDSQQQIQGKKFIKFTNSLNSQNSSNSLNLSNSRLDSGKIPAFGTCGYVGRWK